MTTIGATHGRLSGQRWNGIVDTIVANTMRNVKNVVSELMVDGYPPGTLPLSPFEEYLKLQSMSQVGDPAYFNSPQAQARLARLALQFGPPQSFQRAFEPAVVNNPALMARYAQREGAAAPQMSETAPVVPGT